MAAVKYKIKEISNIKAGPQLKLSNTHLYMDTYIGNMQTSQVTVTNTGTSAVFYQWRKFSRPDFIPAKKSDGQTRFYCHYGKGMLLPGQSELFQFSFTSKTRGIFTQEWDLLTDPLLMSPIPQLVLTGRAYEDDHFIAKRIFFEDDLMRRIHFHSAEEVLNDVIRSIRTPTPPPPDLSDPKQCQEQFESKNVEEKVWHTQALVSLLEQLYEWVFQELPAQIQYEPWDMSIQTLKSMISALKNADKQEKFSKRLDFILKLGKERPPYRSIYWERMKSILFQTAEKVAENTDSIRQELDMEEHYFYLPWEISNEDLELIQKEKAEKEATRVKNPKQKKPKNQEEQAKERENYLERVRKTTGNDLIQFMVGVLDDENLTELEHHLEISHQCKQLPKILRNTNRLNKHMKNSNIANYELFQRKIFPLTQQNLQQLNRKYSLSEIDMEGKKVLLRLDLQLQLSEPIWEQDQIEVDTDEGVEVITQKRCQPRQIIDESKLKPILELIQYCLDHLARCVTIVGSLGEKSGAYREQNSLLPLVDYLQQAINTDVQFLEEIEIENFDEKIQDFPENSIIVIENSAFHPGEFGFKLNADRSIFHQDYDKIIQFRKKLCSYYEIYINDCISDYEFMETSLRDPCSYTNPGCSSVQCIEFGDLAVMGPRIENQIRGICNLFLDADRPITALLGGNNLSKISIVDKIASAYSLVDLVDKIFISGQLAMLILARSHPIHISPDPKLEPLIQKLFTYAAEKGVSIILPQDFLIAEKCQIPQQNPSNFSWGQFADSYTSISISQQLPENAQIVGFGDQTKEKLTEVLLETRRIYWCSSLDLQYTTRDELNLLNKTCLSFLKNNKETKEIMVVIQDIQSSITHLLTADQHLPEESKIEEDEQEELQQSRKLQETGSYASLEGTGGVHVLTPEEILENLINSHLKGGKFTMSILQGRPIRPLLLLSQHPPPKAKNVEEDTSYLDVIQDDKC